MSLPRYPQYKSSGVEWLGSIPSHWTMDRLKRRCNVFPSNVDKKTIKGERAVRLCNYTDVYYNDRIVSDMSLMDATASDEQIAKFTLRAGDTVFTKDSETASDIGVAAYVPSDLPGIVCGYHLSIARPGAGINGVYVKWLFDTHYTKARFAVLANGLTRVGLTQYAVDNVELPWPPLEEQSAISKFIGRETAKIDALIAEQEKLLALLAEKREATISHAVTHGIDPNPPLKDSGIPWLGAVPAHWQIANIKRLCELITDGAHVSPETEDGAFCFVSTKDLGRDVIDFEGCLLTSAASYEYLVRTGCQPLVGDVLFSKDGTVGRTTVVRDTQEFVVASSLIIIRPMGGRLDPDFLDYLCQSRLVKNQVQGFVKGAGLPRLSIQNLLKVVGVFPPLSEQRRISGFLAECLERSDRLENEVLQAMSTLKERRSVLIAAAVTGQIDVRGFVEAQAA